jgi:hypothetical protein
MTHDRGDDGDRDKASEERARAEAEREQAAHERERAQREREQAEQEHKEAKHEREQAQQERESRIRESAPEAADLPGDPTTSYEPDPTQTQGDED